MKKYLLLGFILPILLSGEVVLAHGGEETSAETLHPETQIGLPGPRMGADEAGATTMGMTREDVAALIHDTQATEENRSAVKLTLLTLSIIGLIYVYFPRKSTIGGPGAPTAQGSDPAATNAAGADNAGHAQ